MRQAQSALQKYYGYQEFRGGQEKVIKSLLSGKDTLAIMPTGAGKSVCYQIPALLFPGMTLVVSPLISLMKDQVDDLSGRGIAAAYINSTLNPKETRERLAAACAGRYKLLYVAPERLEADNFSEILANMHISLLAIDEAHCVSAWGHDFRPSYRQIAPFIKALPQRPTVGAFTATATCDVRGDIADLLGLQQPALVVTGFDRPNLSFNVLRGENKRAFVRRYVMSHAEQSGIIYAATRREVDGLYNAMQKVGVAAGRYHAGLKDEERSHMQEEFLYDNIKVMVATNAFGMGIDKSNVRYVLHYNMPKNPEAYYQEAGRAGRDGLPGECILLFSGQDVAVQKFLIEQAVAAPERKSMDYQRLQEMVDFCHTSRCLRGFLLEYFGEKNVPVACGSCSNCNDERQAIDITVDAQMVLSCVWRMRERFGAKLVADVLRGSQGKRVKELGFDQLSTYGLLKQRSAESVGDLIQLLIAEDYLCQTEGQYSVVKLGAAAKGVLSGQCKVWQKLLAPETKQEHTDELFEELRALRREIAAQEKVPPYIIFADSALRDMSAKRPTDMAALLQVKGVGEVKAGRYGQRFLALLDNFAAAQK